MIQKLISRILADANATAESIVAKAEDSAKIVKLNAEEKAMELRQRAHVEMQEQRKRALDSKATVAEIDAKKQILSAKVACVDEVFALALKKLCDNDAKSQTDFVLRMIDQHADCQDVVLLAKNTVVDKQALLNHPTFLSKKLTIEENGDFAGGLILKGKKFDKRLTYEELLMEERGKLQGEIFAMLIKDE